MVDKDSMGAEVEKMVAVAENKKCDSQGTREFHHLPTSHALRSVIG